MTRCSTCNQTDFQCEEGKEPRCMTCQPAAATKAMDAAYDRRVRCALEEIVHSEVTVKEMKNHLKAKGIAVPSKNMLVATTTAIVNDMNEIAEAAAVASPKAHY